MTPFPPMPGPPETPVTPNMFRGVLTDKEGNNIATESAVYGVNETHAGSDRISVRTGGEIVINAANLSASVVGDTVRFQCIDSKGNGDIWYKTIAKGAVDMSHVVLPINALVGHRVVGKLSVRGVTR